MKAWLTLQQEACKASQLKKSANGLVQAHFRLSSLLSAIHPFRYHPYDGFSQHVSREGNRLCFWNSLEPDTMQTCCIIICMLWYCMQLLVIGGQALHAHSQSCLFADTAF